MSFIFDEKIICPEDPTATAERIAQYKEYYKIKYDILKENFPNAKNIGEIGVRAGYSAWTFLQACPEANFYAFDANNGTHGGQGGEDGKFEKWAKKILKNYNLKYFNIDTQKIDKLPVDIKFDFLHIDGDHTIEGVIHDLNLCFTYLSNDNLSFLLIDDYSYIDTVRIGVDRWLNNNRNKINYRFVHSLRGEIIINKKVEKY
jgi:hypothetical protein